MLRLTRRAEPGQQRQHGHVAGDLHDGKLLIFNGEPGESQSWVRKILIRVMGRLHQPAMCEGEHNLAQYKLDNQTLIAKGADGVQVGAKVSTC